MWVSDFLDWIVHLLNAILIEGEISAILKHMNETIESIIIISIFHNVDDFHWTLPLGGDGDVVAGGGVVPSSGVAVLATKNGGTSAKLHWKTTFSLNTQNVSDVARELAIHKRGPVSIYRGLGDRWKFSLLVVHSVLTEMFISGCSGFLLSTKTNLWLDLV